MINSIKRERSAQVQGICAFIRSHYDERIPLERLAAGVGRNAAYMSTLFHRQTGTTIHYYRSADSHAASGDVAAAVGEGRSGDVAGGYRSKKNFYRQFASAFGVTPGSTRQTAVDRSR